MTTIATLRNGLISTFTACGPYSSAQISACDYRILEQTSGCAIIVHFGPELTQEEMTWRGSEWAVVQFTGECYIPFTGDSQKFLGDIYQAVDDIRTTLNKDQKLQSTACFAWLAGVSYNIDEAYNMDGRDWGLVKFQVNIHDL